MNGGGPSFPNPANGSPPIVSQESVPKSKQSIATCTSCQGGDLRRRRRTFWEKPIYTAVYKCMSCGRSWRIVRPTVASTWMGRKLRYAYDRCLQRARHWRPPTPDRNAQTIPWVSRCVDLLREGILELETQLARLRAKTQSGVHSEDRRSENSCTSQRIATEPAVVRPTQDGMPGTPPKDNRFPQNLMNSKS